jgi:two-component system NtrC family sensor kinase
VAVTAALAPHLGMVQSDALQLQQVVSNLIANAEQALAEHLGHRALVLSSVMDGDRVRITVEDSGPGIMPQYLSRVLDPMFTTRGGQGHRGLGLTIAQSIVRDHGGQIEVHSAPGQGARVSIVLPALPTGTSPVAPPATPASATTAAAATILLIEDEVTLRTAIGRFLRASGYVVEAVDSGRAALDQLATRRFDLILLDLRMQGMTGEDVYEEMQARHPDQAQRVVFMTGDLHSPTAAQFIRSTGRPVLAKPFTLADLAARVQQLLAVAR